MYAIRFFSFVFTMAIALAAQAQDIEHRMGQHPAVIVKRMAAEQGYDYVSKFYPHPAWLYLQAEAPRPMMDHPAVIVAKRNGNAGNAQPASETGAMAASLH